MAVDQVSLLRLALQALSRRVAVIITAIMAFALFCWAMTFAGWLRLAIASTFTLLVFLPLLLKGERSAENDS